RRADRAGGAAPLGAGGTGAQAGGDRIGRARLETGAGAGGRRRPGDPGRLRRARAHRAQPGGQRGAAWKRGEMGRSAGAPGARRPPRPADGRGPRSGHRAGGPAPPVRAVLPRPRRGGERDTRQRSGAGPGPPGRHGARRIGVREPRAGRARRPVLRRAPRGQSIDRRSLMETEILRKAGETGATVRRRLLLVEDEPSLVLTLSDRLVAEGYEVETAGDGLLALERATQQ